MKQLKFIIKQIKNVLELKPNKEFDLALEKPNMEIEWKLSPPPPQPHNADSNLVSSLSVKYFSIEDMLLFDYNFAHDTRGKIYHKTIEYCNEFVFF